MQLETLKMYCDLAETQSFTKAARINEITQSAVSQQVSAMERRFQSHLIQRSKKQFRLTREGEAVYDYSKQIVRTYAELHSKMAQLKDEISGAIRIAVIYTFGLYDLPPFLKKYLQRFPTVNVHVEYRHARQIYEDVLSNVVDLGLVAYPGRNPKLKVIPLHRDNLVVICHPHHPLAAGKSIKLRHLSGLPFISFAAGVPIRKMLERVFRERKLQVRGTMEFDNIDTLKRAVEIDAGVSIVPQGTVEQEVATGSLARLAISDVELHRPLAIIHRAERVLTPAMKEFIAVLKAPA